MRIRPTITTPTPAPTPTPTPTPASTETNKNSGSPTTQTPSPTPTPSAENTNSGIYFGETDDNSQNTTTENASNDAAHNLPTTPQQAETSSDANNLISLASRLAALGLPEAPSTSSPEQTAQTETSWFDDMPEAPSNPPTHVSDSNVLTDLEARLAALRSDLPSNTTEQSNTAAQSSWFDDMPEAPTSTFTSAADLISENRAIAASESITAPRSREDTPPSSALNQETINALRDINASDQNWGMRFGRNSDPEGFTGDAYSLVPSQYGDNTEMLNFMNSRFPNNINMSDQEFSQSIGTAIDNSVMWEFNKVSEPNITLQNSLEQIANDFNILLANMGNGPTNERYDGRGDTQTTPKFGRRNVDADAIQGQIRLVPDTETRNTTIQPHAMATDLNDLNKQLQDAGFDLNKPLAEQQPQVVDFVAQKLAEILNNLIMETRA